MPSEDEYRDEFVDFTDNESEIDFETFYFIYQESGSADDLETFFQFLNAFYPEDESGLHDRAFWQDLQNAYYEYSGITSDNIDWAALREWLEENTP